MYQEYVRVFDTDLLHFVLLYYYNLQMSATTFKLNKPQVVSFCLYVCQFEFFLLSRSFSFTYSVKIIVQPTFGANQINRDNDTEYSF